MHLLENPFYLLGATPRDDKGQLMDLADEKSLVDESDRISDARMLLSNPGKRVSCEVSWLAGISPKQANSLIDAMMKNPGQIYQELQENGLPPLAATNLLASAMTSLPEEVTGSELSKWIIGLSVFHDEIDTEDLGIVLNEEREISRFSAIKDLSRIEDALAEQRNYYKQVIKGALNKLPPKELVLAVTKSIENTTSLGLHPASLIIHQMVDSFEVESQQFLDKETNNVDIIVKRILNSAQNETHRESIIPELVTELETILKNWDFVAQPMQVNCRSKGIKHELSLEVAANIRSLALELFNTHGLLDISQRITLLQKEVFSEVDSVLEQLTIDENALEEIAFEREDKVNSTKEDIKKWEDEITYEVEIGVPLFRKKLRISPNGVEYKDKSLTLADIVGIRWGGTQKNNSTEFSVTVRTSTDIIFIQTGNNNIYTNFIERLWKSVGVRLLTELFECTKSGRHTSFGTARVYDTGIELSKTKLFGDDEKSFFSWKSIKSYSQSGLLIISSIEDPKYHIQLSYELSDNVHILNTAINFLNDNNATSFSEIL